MLQPSLLETFKYFEPTVGSSLADYIMLNPPSDEFEVISVAKYLQPESLMQMIEARAVEEKIEDLRVAGAVSNKIYHWAVLPGVLALMTLAGVGLDASVENVSLVFKDGEPQALWLHNLNHTVIYPPRFPLPIPNDYSGKLLTSVDQLHSFVFAGLFQRHLSLLIERVHALTKVSKKTLWGNAANTCNSTYEELKDCINTEVVQADYLTLLEQPHSPVMPGRNPLYKLMRTETLNEPGLPAEIRVRATCCLIALYHSILLSVVTAL